MRQGFVALLSTLVAFVAIQQRSSAQRPSQPPNLSIQATTVAQLRTWDAFVTSESRSGSLRLRRTERDPMLPARVVERFDQFYQGVPIWGADVVRDSERGVPMSVFGELASPDLQLSTSPALSADQARAALLSLGGADALVLVEPDLVISRLDSGEHRLAYTGVVSANSDVVRAFVDAQTGVELMRYSEIRSQQAAVGTGAGVLGDQKKLSVETSTGGFIASDRLRPPTIQTFDLRGDLSRTKALLNRQLPYVANDLARDTDNVWNDSAVVDAHAHVSWTYDYYFKRFGRSGLDGRNGPVNVIVNPVPQQSALSFPTTDQGSFVFNAFYSDIGGPNGGSIMVFGSGIPAGTTDGRGRNWASMSGALDVSAHELTHGVTSATSDLVYQNESGALNEALSDIIGESVEFFYQQQRSAVSQPDYVAGKDVVRAVASGALSGLRSLANPSLYGHPDHYARYVLTATDNGGVHTNSGIPNHVFYLAIEGGTNRTSGLSVQGVGAANREQIEKVFFRAFTLLLPASATFSTARVATIQAARDLYGAGGAVERAVTQAWDSVGVTETSSITRLTPLTGTLPATNNTRYFYAVTMPETGRYRAVLDWSDTSVDLDLMIGRPGCASNSCLLSRSAGPGRRPETVCVDVRAGEQYWVLFENLSPRPTAFTLQQSITPPTTAACAAPSTTAAPDTGGGLTLVPFRAVPLN